MGYVVGPAPGVSIEEFEAHREEWVRNAWPEIEAEWRRRHGWWVWRRQVGGVLGAAQIMVGTLWVLWALALEANPGIGVGLFSGGLMLGLLAGSEREPFRPCERCGVAPRRFEATCWCGRLKLWP